MAYKFTDGNKWRDKWFKSLSPEAKLLFLYLTDNCDMGGFIEYDEEDFSYHTKIPLENISGATEGLTRGKEAPSVVLVRGWVWLPNHVRHQKNLPLNPDNNAHKSAIKSIQKHASDFPQALELIEHISPLSGATEGLPRGYRGANKGQGRATGKGKGKGNTKNIVINNKLNNKLSNKLSNTTDEDKSNVEKKDFIDTLVEDFCECYLSHKGQPYMITNEGKERSSMVSILGVYKKKNPGADSMRCRDDLKTTWGILLSAEFKTEYLRAISIAKISRHLSEYMEIIRYERLNNQSHKPGRGHIDKTAYRDFISEANGANGDQLLGGAGGHRSLSPGEGTDFKRNGSGLVQNSEEYGMDNGNMEEGAS